MPVLPHFSVVYHSTHQPMLKSPFPLLPLGFFVIKKKKKIFYLAVHCSWYFIGGKFVHQTLIGKTSTDFDRENVNCFLKLKVHNMNRITVLSKLCKTFHGVQRLSDKWSVLSDPMLVLRANCYLSYVPSQRPGQKTQAIYTQDKLVCDFLD